MWLHFRVKTRSTLDGMAHEVQIKQLSHTSQSPDSFLFFPDLLASVYRFDWWYQSLFLCFFPFGTWRATTRRLRAPQFGERKTSTQRKKEPAEGQKRAGRLKGLREEEGESVMSSWAQKHCLRTVPLLSFSGSSPLFFPSLLLPDGVVVAHIALILQSVNTLLRLFVFFSPSALLLLRNQCLSFFQSHMHAHIHLLHSRCIPPLSSTRLEGPAVSWCGVFNKKHTIRLQDKGLGGERRTGGTETAVVKENVKWRKCLCFEPRMWILFESKKRERFLFSGWSRKKDQDPICTSTDSWDQKEQQSNRSVPPCEFHAKIPDAVSKGDPMSFDDANIICAYFVACITMRMHLDPKLEINSAGCFVKKKYVCFSLYGQTCVNCFVVHFSNERIKEKGS